MEKMRVPYLQLDDACIQQITILPPMWTEARLERVRWLRCNQYPKMEKSGYTGDKEDVNMKLEKEALQLINACLGGFHL